LTVVLFTCHQAGLPTYDQSINGAAPWKYALPKWFLKDLDDPDM
jgi:hypothetical protein